MRARRFRAVYAFCLENETHDDDDNGQGGASCHVNVMSLMP